MKNVAVTDEQGKVYEPTYLRRAKGLVKKGRARWAGPDAICLTCPPSENKEDTLMNETIHMVPSDQPVPAVPAPSEVSPAPAAANPEVSCPETERATGIRQAIAILDRIRSTAIHGSLVCALFPFIDAYNGIYDAAVSKGWIRQTLGITRVPEGLGTSSDTHSADLKRVGGMAALLMNMLSFVPHDVPPEAVQAPSEEEREEWKQAVSLLDCIRSTAVCGNMTPCLLPFLGAYNGIYDNAVKRGWLKEPLGLQRIPEGTIGTNTGTWPWDMQRLGGMAAMLMDYLNNLPWAYTVPQSAPPSIPGIVSQPSWSDHSRGSGGDAGPRGDIEDWGVVIAVINDTVQAAVADALSDLDPDDPLDLDDLNDEIQERIEEAMVDAMSQFHS